MEKQRLVLKCRKEHIFARRRSSFLAASAASAHLFAALTSGPSAFVPPALRAFASRVIPAHLFPAFGRAVSLCLRSSAALRAFASAPIPVDQRRQRLLCPLLLLLRHGQALRFASSPSLSSPSPSSPGGGGSSSFLAASAASAHLFAALKRAVCASAVAWWLPPRQCIRRQDPGTPPRNLKARIPAFSSHHAIAVRNFPSGNFLHSHWLSTSITRSKCPGPHQVCIYDRAQAPPWGWGVAGPRTRGPQIIEGVFCVLPLLPFFSLFFYFLQYPPIKLILSELFPDGATQRALVSAI